VSERAASRDAHRPRGFLAGVSFLTRIPVRVAIGEADVAASTAWFSVVGALIGAASGAVYVGARELWPSSLAARGTAPAVRPLPPMVWFSTCVASATSKSVTAS